MDRRKFVAFIGSALAAPFGADAQPAARALRIAILDDASEDTQRNLWRAFFKRLAELGFVEGRNLAVDVRYARGATERLPAMARELLTLTPDVVVARGTPSALAVKLATAAMPVVFLHVADPVRTGLVASLAHPGANLTGLTIISPDIVTKLLELLLQITPATKKVGYLGDASNKGGVRAFEQLQKYASSMRVTVQFFDGRLRAALERSFAELVQGKFDGLVVGNTGLLLDHRDQIVQFAARQKIPTAYSRREYVDAGGLLSYGAELGVMYQRAADYVNRIAQGAKPAELPVEQPTIVRMTVNLKTARAQGIKIPQIVLVRANEVIE